MSNRIKLKGTSERSFDIGLSNKQTFDASNLTANRTWILPDSNGSNNYVLSTDGSGNLNWVAQTGGGGNANVIINTQPLIQFTANTTGNSQVFSNANISNFGSNVYAAVYINGVLQQPQDYIISGSNLTIVTNLNTGDDIIIGPTYNGIAGGNTTEIQFNDSGVFGGDAAFTWNKTTDTLTISGDIANVDSITFDTTATETSAVAKMFWDDGYGMLQYTLKGGNYDVKIGEDLATLCYNGTGNTIAKGKVVYIAGAQGQRISVGLADNSTDATSSKTFGVVAESFPNGEEKFVVTQGMLRGINTNAYSPGTVLWLGTNGDYTSTKPTAPAHLVFVGVVLKQHAVSGEIYVKPQNGYELDEIHDVKITTPVANSSVLQYDSANSLWINQTTSQLRTSANIGNIANINLNGNGSQVLAGNGTWVTQSTGGGETFNQFMLMGA